MKHDQKSYSSAQDFSKFMQLLTRPALQWRPPPPEPRKQVGIIDALLIRWLRYVYVYNRNMIRQGGVGVRDMNMHIMYIEREREREAERHREREREREREICKRT